MGGGETPASPITPQRRASIRAAAMEHLTSRANLTLLISTLTLITTCTFYYYNIALTWQMHHASTFNEVCARCRLWDPLLRLKRSSTVSTRRRR